MLALKPFQEEGCTFLASRRFALLADQMRLGKTAQAIRAAEVVDSIDNARRPQRLRVLVVCPAIARTHWKMEFKRWYRNPPPHLEVVSYDYARANHKRRSAGICWDILILDESHYLKNPAALRTRAALGKSGLAWNARRVWALSGTPAPNHAGEMWPLLLAAGATKMRYRDFLDYFCYCDENGKPRGTRRDHMQEFKSLLEPIMLRRLTKNVASELPKCSLVPYYVDADPLHVDLARPVNTKDWIAKATKAQRKLKKALAELQPDEQLAYLERHVVEFATMRRILSVMKVPAVLELLHFEFDNRLLDKIVIFGYHHDGLRIIRELLRGTNIRADILYGGTPAVKRDNILKRFNKTHKQGGIDVLCAQILAAGTAIDLSASHEGILLERDWVPANNAQALERMGGYKQTQPVTIRDILILDSADEIVARTVNRKTAELGEIFDQGDTA